MDHAGRTCATKSSVQAATNPLFGCQSSSEELSEEKRKGKGDGSPDGASGPKMTQNDTSAPEVGGRLPATEPQQERKNKQHEHLPRPPALSPASSPPPAVKPAAIVPIIAGKETSVEELELELDAAPRTPRLRRGVVTKSRTDHPGFCTGDMIGYLLLLSFAFIIEAVYFIFHCSPIMDLMVAEEDALSWLGVAPAAKVFAGLLLVPAMLWTLNILGTLTCLWHRTVRRAHKKAHEIPWRRVRDSKTTFGTLRRCLRYLRRPSAAHYLRLLFIMEIKEFIVQVLAVDQMSRAGIGSTALLVYTSAILLNGIAPIVMGFIMTRINRMGYGDDQRRRVEASKWIARLLLFDATSDLLYSSFPIVHLLTQYFQIFSGDRSHSNFELDILENYAAQSPISASDLKAYMLLSEGENTLFGGKNGFDVLIKFMSRILPLIQAPYRVRSAFRIRQGMSAAAVVKSAVKHKDLIGKISSESGAFRVRQSMTTATLGKSAGDTRVAQELTNKDGRQEGIKAKLQHLAARSVEGTAFNGRYQTVPLWLISILVSSVLGLCLYIFIQLGTWGECPIPEIRQSCAVRAFPIFRRYDSDADFGCRSCACNTLVYASTNCTAVVSASNSFGMENQTTITTTSKCFAGVGDGRSRYASEILNLSSAILQPAVAIFINFCPLDTNLLKTLSHRAGQPSVVFLQMISPERRRNLSNAHGNVTADTTALVNWTFPPRFGYQDGGASDSIWPLLILEIRAHEASSVRLTGLPPDLTELTALRSFVAEGLSVNQLPSSIGQLTNLRTLFLENNLIAAVPSSIGQLTGIRHLNINNNVLTSLPSSMGRLTRLKDLSLDRNRLTSFPSFIGRFTALQALHIHSNELTSVPSFIGRLTALKYLYLHHNALTEIPALIMGASRSLSRSFRLNVEANRISFAAMSAALAGIPSSSAFSAGSLANPPSALLLIGKNPACNESDNVSLASRVGPWRIKCEPECGVDCRETGVGDDIGDSVGNGECNPECDTLACRWDGGDCTG